MQTAAPKLSRELLQQNPGSVGLPCMQVSIENHARIFHLRVRRARIITNPMRRKWSYPETETEHVPLRIPS